MGKVSIVLGVSFGHGDSSAALIVDGCLVAAAEEERFCRRKHYALFPSQAVQYCLKHARISAKEVEVLAIARQPWNQWRERLKLSMRHPALMGARRNHRPDGPRKSPSRAIAEAGLSRARIVRVEHHFAHLLSARILSDASEMSLLSFDALGDFVSTAIGRAEGHGVEILDRIVFPHSLGFFYSAMTHYLGFPRFGDEFKVMGLSSYGRPRFLSVMKGLVREETHHFGFRLNLEAFPLFKTPPRLEIEKGQPKAVVKYNANLLTQVLGVPPRKPTDPITEAHWDVAKSVQVRFEEVATHLLLQLHDRAPSQTLGLAGGCAHNSVWVGKIPQLTPFRKIHVAPASNDAGIAVGAAAFATDSQVRPEGRHWALLGPNHNETPDEKKSSSRKAAKEHLFPNDEKLIDWIVGELCQKKIVGLFRGRMEFGPRALGHRSILADPRWEGMREKLNARVKHREGFRPFAASVQWEHQDQWFVNSFFSPSMEAVFEVKSPQRIPAVVHADNTCRVQSVTRDTQPFYWDLIEAFRRKSGIPMLLNTSFNDSEPIVCSEADVWACFNTTSLDIIVVGNRAYTKAADNYSLTG